MKIVCRAEELKPRRAGTCFRDPSSRGCNSGFVILVYQNIKKVDVDRSGLLLIVISVG